MSMSWMSPQTSPSLLSRIQISLGRRIHYAYSATRGLSGPGQVYPDESPGPLPKDPWEIEFHWATAGAAVPGFWIVDAWLASATFGGNLHVPSALVLPQAVPPAGNQRYAHIVLVPAGAVPLPPFVPPGEFLTARLYRLYTVLRFVDTANLVRVACRGEGPLIEFFLRE